MSKRCPKCAVEKPRAAFYTDKSKPGGLSSYCKPCRIAASVARQNADPEKRKLYLSGFYRKNTARYSAYGRARYEANREAIAAATGAWRRAHPDKASEYGRTYRRANPDKRAALVARYRCAQADRTPPWLNQAHFAEVEGAYHFAKVMELITGEKYHVDHIEPLQGVEVSGLHVPWNLRVIPARENFMKGNRRVATSG